MASIHVSGSGNRSIGHHDSSAGAVGLQLLVDDLSQLNNDFGVDFEPVVLLVIAIIARPCNTLGVTHRIRAERAANHPRSSGDTFHGPAPGQRITSILWGDVGVAHNTGRWTNE